VATVTTWAALVRVDTVMQVQSNPQQSKFAKVSCRGETPQEMIGMRAPARDFSRAASIAAWYPGMSTCRPSSSAMRPVRSTGKPYVSHSSNAAGPSTRLLLPVCGVHAKSSAGCRVGSNRQQHP